jgi:predicted nucleotidyltransferase
MLTTGQIQAIQRLCRKITAVELFYLHGSAAHNQRHKGSDYDFAVLFKHQPGGRYGALQLDLAGNLIAALRFDAVDLVVLNRCYNSILKFNVVQCGRLLFERPGCRIDYETRTKHEYYDFMLLEKQAGSRASRRMSV